MKNNIAIQASNNIEENKEIIKILESLGGKTNFLLNIQINLIVIILEKII